MDDVMPNKEFQSTFIDKVGESSMKNKEPVRINVEDVVSMVDNAGLLWNNLTVTQVGTPANGMQWILYAEDIKTILYVTSYTTLRKTG